MKPRLKFIYAPMNSGKSLLLIANAYGLQERGVQFLAMKSAIDDRNNLTTISSRCGLSRDCVLIKTDTDVFDVVKNHHAHVIGGLRQILVDEAQFLSEKQIDQLSDVVDKLGIDVTCYGLRTDFQSHLFPGSKRLFELADEIGEVESSCSCGDKTIINARIDQNGMIVTDGSQIEIGGEDKYITLCRKCWKKAIENQKQGNLFAE
ncbi:MAG: thymidine kinase [Paludibacteraceae bacterium]|nr:thymidine kinase [Paludibacteraceae bacterium]